MSVLAHVLASDDRLSGRIVAWRPPRWVRVWMLAATRLGDGWLWLAAALVLATSGDRGLGVLWAGAVSAGLANVFLLGVKGRIRRPRPCDGAKPLHFDVDPLAWFPSGRFSFPSGHALNAFAMGSVIARRGARPRRRGVRRRLARGAGPALALGRARGGARGSPHWHLRLAGSPATEVTLVLLAAASQTLPSAGVAGEAAARQRGDADRGRACGGDAAGGTDRSRGGAGRGRTGAGSRRDGRRLSVHPWAAVRPPGSRDGEGRLAGQDEAEKPAVRPRLHSACSTTAMIMGFTPRSGPARRAHAIVAQADPCRPHGQELAVVGRDERRQRGRLQLALGGMELRPPPLRSAPGSETTPEARATHGGDATPGG
jgi:hypothetical protein